MWVFDCYCLDCLARLRCDIIVLYVSLFFVWFLVFDCWVWRFVCGVWCGCFTRCATCLYVGLLVCCYLLGFRGFGFTFCVWCFIVCDLVGCLSWLNVGCLIYRFVMLVVVLFMMFGLDTCCVLFVSWFWVLLFVVFYVYLFCCLMTSWLCGCCLAMYCFVDCVLILYVFVVLLCLLMLDCCVWLV